MIIDRVDVQRPEPVAFLSSQLSQQRPSKSLVVLPAHFLEETRSFEFVDETRLASTTFGSLRLTQGLSPSKAGQAFLTGVRAEFFIYMLILPDLDSFFLFFFHHLPPLRCIPLDLAKQASQNAHVFLLQSRSAQDAAQGQ